MKNYYQKVDNKNSQFLEIDRKTINRNKFKTRVRKLWLVNEGFSAWRVVSNTDTYAHNTYNVLPFDTKTFRSVGIDITKDSEHKFRVDKAGLYEINIGWLIGLSDNTQTQMKTCELWLSKNGITLTTDNDNFLFLDHKNIYYGCTETENCEDYKDIASLQGTKHLWLERGDYFEVYMMPYSTLDLASPDSHDGFIEIKYITNKTRQL